MIWYLTRINGLGNIYQIYIRYNWYTYRKTNNFCIKMLTFYTENEVVFIYNRIWRLQLFKPLLFSNDLYFVTLISISLYKDKFWIREKFENAKGVIWSCKWKKDRQYNCQNKRTKRQTMIYKSLHRKLRFEQHEPH